MQDKIGSLIIDIHGTALTPEDVALIKHPLVAGIILFSRNYQSKAQLRTLCSEIRGIKETPLLIMVDQEGGRVQRLRGEFTAIPPMAKLGDIYNDDAAMAFYLTKQCGWLLAVELLAVGIDFSIAPVLDLNLSKNTVIGMRAFHRDPQAVIFLAKAFIEGMKHAGMASVGKHFPGHGHVLLDSHLAAPVSNLTFSELMHEDLIPFVTLMENYLTGILVSHITFPSIHSKQVVYSDHWLGAILREKFKFNGPIFSDDLNMEGANISSDFKIRFKTAKEAGCDFVLICNNRPAVVDLLENINPEAYFVPYTKMARLHGNFSYSKSRLEHDPLFLTARENLRNHLTVQL